MLTLNEALKAAGLPPADEPSAQYAAVFEALAEIFEKETPAAASAPAKVGGKLNMSKATVVKLSSGDAGVELKGDVFGIRNDNEIVEFMLAAMGVPRDGLAIRIRSGFMQYDNRSKMLFIARFKSDLPNNRSEKVNEDANAQSLAQIIVDSAKGDMKIAKGLILAARGEKKRADLYVFGDNSMLSLADGNVQVG